jgi:hypothetical protein
MDVFWAGDARIRDGLGKKNPRKLICLGCEKRWLRHHHIIFCLQQKAPGYAILDIKKAPTEAAKTPFNFRYPL